MPIKRVIGLYLGILLPILALYVFTVIFSVYAPTATPQLSAAIPVFMDLIKIIVGGAIGAFSVIIGHRVQ
ncbi:hypothetical protein [Bradyrhizobium sp. CB2312]|uniref:hypothetical protein n=1 Tax=Bradyrhizobium sp. CB2312 TaxID=3039155 RepID=UPI0024B07151|nr:hypothetical protein [Bradyrhizobium sp. CB2312]WFU70024.1 hypothetical protein QA642_32750 [Bradyrhizobium sp. CB2312]